MPYEHVIIEFLLKLQHSDYTLVSKTVCTSSVFQMFVVFSDVPTCFIFCKIFFKCALLYVRFVFLYDG